ncbi:octanoyltransferase [Formosimonas limnophila]|uniref:Octanoyltransferase n=1 Tax=Formosimonas limnophila TaxID=1384487 RepID=A0A8J3G077_9BURK|nr:lipoyl(octanoyl) transferase LipB [Formosimonas limnophila]GHA70364.1 octanoyltransferase [Formosimonas limnophila]
MSELIVKRLGRVDYLPTEQAMREFTATRDASTPDELWLVEHPPVFTLGQAGLAEHLLQAGDIPLVKTERGGQITYHGPGQVVIYMMLDLKRRGIMVREWVRRIEGAIILTLADYGITGVRKDGAPGIYVGQGTHEGAKIAALGLKVKRGCTYHGLSFNVDMDLTPFLHINPCGYAGLETVDMKTLGVTATWADVAEQLAQSLVSQWQADESQA